MPRPQVAPLNNVDAQAGRGPALDPLTRRGPRTRAGLQAILAQVNIFYNSGRRRCWIWVTSNVGSSPASSLRR